MAPEPPPAEETAEQFMARVAPDPARPCIHCPWLLTNQGKRHPDGWYTKANLRRLWAGIRTGEGMSCHPTDPDNPVSERARAAGYRPAPEGAKVRECVGAIILVQREVMKLDRLYAGDGPAYRRENKRGLTRDGLAAWLWRMMAGGTPLSGPKVPRPDLNAPVGVDGVSWDPERIAAEGEINPRRDMFVDVEEK